MIVTLISTLVVLVSYFLILLSVVAFIQDKRFYKSAPKEVYDAISDERKGSKREHIIGWILFIFSVLSLIASFVVSGIDGVINDIGYLFFFLRFIFMLYIMEIYDIFFFDYFLLCHSSFFPHFCKEVKDIVGPHLFGFNKKTHIIHFIVYIPLSCILALIFFLFSTI